MTTTGGDEKAAVANYFNGVGFERWNKIYGTTDDVNSVRVRPVHAPSQQGNVLHTLHLLSPFARCSCHGKYSCTRTNCIDGF